MVNLLDYRTVTKKEAEKVVKQLKKIQKINENLRGFKIESEKNNRGDYGLNEIYYYKDNPFLMLSFDGARLDTQYYIRPDTYLILSEAEKMAKFLKILFEIHS
jgi:hypothetical protein